MAERVSPLRGLTGAGLAGAVGEAGPGVRLSTRTDLVLWQAAAWPDTAAAVEAAVAAHVGVAPPPPGRVATGPGGALVRLSPLKWWVIDGTAPALTPDTGATLDLSHEQTPVRVAGRDAAALLARIVAVDLRDGAFPVGAFAATGGHHLMLKLRRLGPDAYELFAMRSLARHLWETLHAHALQFGVEAA
jgi:sarcosine oxidase subunit gamma